MSIKVRVTELGAFDDDVELERGATVRDALERAGRSSSNAKTLRLNGSETTLDTAIRDNDVIFLVPGLKGNK